MVTRMDYEEVTDDEADGASAITPDADKLKQNLTDAANKENGPAPEVNKEKKAPAPVAAKPKKVEAAKASGQQKSMMSFFGKKA
jgi:hypothetical protein